MRIFALCSNKSSKNIALKHRAVWNNERLKQALSTLKQTQCVKLTAKEIGVTPDSLKRALRRRGLTMRAALGRINQAKKTTGTDTIFAPSANLSDNSPFIAQAAFEAKPANGCSWPIGDLMMDDFRFCGAKRAKGSYCLECYERAYMPAPPLSELRIEAYI